MEKVLEQALHFYYLRKSDKFSLGALGLILLENIRREWVCSVSSSQLEPFFRTTNLDAAVYSEIYKLNDKKLPLGLITLQNCDFNMKHDQRKFYKDMNLLYFCHPTTEMKWYDYWLRSRRAWWAKYLRHPDLIAQKSLGEDSVALDLMLPSMSIELENVSRRGSSFFDDTIDAQQYTITGKKSAMPSVIQITSSSHQGFLAILADAFSLRCLKKKSMDKSCVFQIHHLLAPWKVGFGLPLEKVSTGQPLYELAMLLSSELKSLQIDVAPFKLGSTDSCAKWFDGAGVPFSVLLSPETLTNGICSLRTRDTTLSEKVHVGSLKQHLGKYLIRNLCASNLK